MKKLALFVVFFVLAAAVPVVVMAGQPTDPAGSPVDPGAPPSLPFSPYGTVTQGDGAAAAGIPIAAYCHGQNVRSTTTQTWAGDTWYANLDVPGDDPDTPNVLEGCQSAETITFTIGSLTAIQTARFSAGSAPRLDLADWDKSSLTLDGGCLANQIAEFIVTNTGQAMQGDTTWHKIFANVEVTGTLRLAAGETQTFTFPAPGDIVFSVEQRPGHPGSSLPTKKLNCVTSSVGLTSFTATSGGTRVTETCVVTDYQKPAKGRAGYVAVRCRTGHVAGSLTWRVFRIGQAVRVTGYLQRTGELAYPRIY